MIMHKVDCPKCSGYGYFIKLDAASMWREYCEECGGSGTITVPITNFEHIKEMSIEELALFLENFNSCNRCRKRGNDCFPNFDIEKWLTQEAE
jgi:hypothetical protein